MYRQLQLLYWETKRASTAEITGEGPLATQGGPHGGPRGPTAELVTGPASGAAAAAAAVPATAIVAAIAAVIEQDCRLGYL